MVENPGIVREYLDKYLPAIISFLIQLLVAVVVLLVGIKIINAFSKWIKKTMDRSRMDAGAVSFLSYLIKYVLYFLLIVMILSRFGVTTGSVVALLGSAGLTVGLALQGSLSNFAGGVLILLLKPFSIGDYIVVESSDKEGTVKDVSLYYTKLNTIDNKVILIPNGTLAASSIVNVSMMEKRRIDITVGVAYDSNLEKTKAALAAAVAMQPEVLREEKTDIFVSELGDSAIIMGVRVWVKNSDFWNVKWKLTEDIKYKLDEEGIVIPFPQMDVHMLK